MQRFICLLVLLLASLGLASCQSLKGACEDCCKERLKGLVKSGMLSSQQGYHEKELCTQQCVEYAEANNKDADWVERKQACGIEE